jgi:hypothetical protein
MGLALHWKSCVRQLPSTLRHRTLYKETMRSKANGWFPLSVTVERLGAIPYYALFSRSDADLA